jgi:hypothetical protein
MCCSHAEIFLAALGFLGCLAYLSQEWEGRYRNTGHMGARGYRGYRGSTRYTGYTKYTGYKVFTGYVGYT